MKNEQQLNTSNAKVMWVEQLYLLVVITGSTAKSPGLEVNLDGYSTVPNHFLHFKYGDMLNQITHTQAEAAYTDWHVI